MAKKKSSRRKTTKKTAGAAGAGGSPASLGRATTEDLQRELQRRQRSASRLIAKRDKLAGQLAELDAELASLGLESGMGVTARGTVRRRPRNESNLADALVAELTGKEMSVTEAAESVVASGYKTSSANFRTIVNQTLLKDKRFKKVSRGRYTAK